MVTPSEPTVRLHPLRTSIMQNAVIWREGGVYHAWKAQRWGEEGEKLFQKIPFRSLRTAR